MFSGSSCTINESPGGRLAHISTSQREDSFRTSSQGKGDIPRFVRVPAQTHPSATMEPKSKSSNRAQRPWIDEPCRRIGVIATDRETASSTTLAALERIFPVRFERIQSAIPDGLDGVLVLGAAPSMHDEDSWGLPKLVLPADPDSQDSTLDRASEANFRQADHANALPGQMTKVTLSADPSLARPMRGRVIHEQTLPSRQPPVEGNCVTLASVAGRPVWWRVGEETSITELSTYPLARLDPGEALREHLCAGRFMGLLPLVSFVSRLLGESGWKLPPLRACFVVDDPNLHWTSYGFLDYAELIEHATRHGYHMEFATVPLDGWLIKRKAVTLLADNSSVLSLAVHGNDHIARELARRSTDAEAEAAIAQGLRRVAALERRSGLQVEHVLVPPHGACSEAVLRATFRLGGEAACISRPYPWLDKQPAPTSLAGWHPADLVAGGLPVLPRHPLSASREDLALRALLGHPLILYGHHVDFADGLDVLAQAASEINSLGEVQWGSLGWIARGNYSTRRSQDTLLVKMHARRIAVEVPAGVSALRALVDEPVGGAAGHRLAHTGGDVGIAFENGAGASEPLVVVGPAHVDLALKADKPLDPSTIRSPAIHPWPLLRRALVETRDRMQPLLRSTSSA